MAKSTHKQHRAQADETSRLADQKNTAEPQDKTPYYIIAALIVVVTLAVYWQVVGFDFITMDDYLHVTHNSHVRSGLTVDSARWAFTGVGAGNWHPLTWLSLMLDYESARMDPSLYHFTNLILHLANTLLLLLVLSRITGFFWRSAFVAALFALHPLHVESVAWISERKDVLSTLFWLLTLLAYSQYAKQPSVRKYLLTAFMFALGLMSKPMVVTLPVTLLLLDYWPLNRLAPLKTADSRRVRESESGERRAESPDSIRRLIIEKLPLFVMIVPSAIVTVYAQRAGGAMVSLDQFPFNIRWPNAVVSYVTYLIKTFWPTSLAPFYPHPGHSIPVWQIVGSAIVLVAITYLAVRMAKTRPYFIFGWLWYLVTLLPVIGLIQVGSQAFADRYTYVPLIGIFIIIAWGIPDLIAVRASKRQTVSTRTVLMGAFAALVLLALAVQTYSQIGYWRNDVTIWSHTVGVTGPNSLAEYNLGCALDNRKQYGPAIEHYTRAIDIDPKKSEAYNNLGCIYLKSRKFDEAERLLSEALRLKPDYVQAHCNMGLLLNKKNEFEESTRHYILALKYDPKDSAVRSSYSTGECEWGVSLARQGRVDEAIDHFHTAMEIDPQNAMPHYNLGVALDSLGKYDEAIEEYSEAIRLEPENADAHNNLGVLLGQAGKFDEAISHFEEVLRIRPDYKKARVSLEHFTMLKQQLKAK